MASVCQSETSSTTKNPSWVLKQGKNAFKRVEKFSRKPMTASTEPLTAELTPAQTEGISGVRNYAATGGPDVFGDVSRDLQAYSDAGPQSISTERVVDEGGKLGSMDDYINPYISRVLDPALRQITEASSAERKRLGDTASSAGAYGDARHGVVESRLNRDTETAIGDTTARTYSDAFDKALATRTGDLNRFLGVDTANANFNETALQRKGAGATALSGAADAEQARKLGLLQSLLTAGGVEQQTNQNRSDAAYREALRKDSTKADKMNLLLSFLTGTPTNRTTTNSQPDNSILSLLGAVGGAAL